MRRTSLEDLVLTVLLLELGHPQEFLQKGEGQTVVCKNLLNDCGTPGGIETASLVPYPLLPPSFHPSLSAIEHPSPRAVEAAISTLIQIQAIATTPSPAPSHPTYKGQVITLKPLGYHLAHLPVDVRLGKMVSRCATPYSPDHILRWTADQACCLCRWFWVISSSSRPSLIAWSPS